MKKVEIEPLPEAENKNKLKATLSTGNIPIPTVKLSDKKKKKDSQKSITVIFFLLMAILTVALTGLIIREFVNKGFIHFSTEKNTPNNSENNDLELVEFTDIDRGFTVSYPDYFIVQSETTRQIEEIMINKEECIVFLQSRDEKMDLVISNTNNGENECIPIAQMTENNRQTLDSGNILIGKTFENGLFKYNAVSGINQKFGIEVTIFYSANAITQAEIFNNVSRIIDTFDVPDTWRTSTSNLCNLNLHIPPNTDSYSTLLPNGETKLWRYTESSTDFLGLFNVINLVAYKGETKPLAEDNLEGSIQIFCNENNTGISTDELFTTFENELETRNLSVGNSQKGTMWDKEIYFLTITGEGQNPNDLYYLFSTDTKVYLIYKTSIGSTFIKNTTDRIFENIDFEVE